MKSSQKTTVTADRDSLLPILARASSVIERRNTIPILGHTLLKASEGELVVEATDLDIAISAHLPANVAGDGAVTVSGATLHDVIRKLPEGCEIRLEWSDDTPSMSVKAGRSRFSLSTLPAQDWPGLATPEWSHRFEMRASALEAQFSAVSFAQSTVEARYYLCGIYWHAVEGKIRAVATNGHRLALDDRDDPGGVAGMPGIIIPSKTVREIIKALKDKPPEMVQVALSSVKIQINIGRTTLTSKLIDGTYPDYGRVIPRHNDKIMIADREELARAAERVSTISSERGRAIKLSLADGTLGLSVANPDAGTAADDITVDYEGSPVEISFNARYLADALAAIEGENVSIALADVGSPALIKQIGNDDFLTILMPTRV